MVYCIVFSFCYVAFILYSNAVFCSPTPFPELYRASINWQEIMSVSQTPQSLAFKRITPEPEALYLNTTLSQICAQSWHPDIKNPEPSKPTQAPHYPHRRTAPTQEQLTTNAKIPRPLNRKPWTSKPNTQKPWPPKPQTLTPWMPNPKSPDRPRAGAIMTTGPQLVSGFRV